MKKNKKNKISPIEIFNSLKLEQTKQETELKEKYSYFTLGKRIEYLGIPMIVGYIHIDLDDQFIVGDSNKDGTIHYERLDSNRMDIILDNLKNEINK